MGRTILDQDCLEKHSSCPLVKLNYLYKEPKVSWGVSYRTTSFRPHWISLLYLIFPITYLSFQLVIWGEVAKSSLLRLEGPRSAPQNILVTILSIPHPVLAHQQSLSVIFQLLAFQNQLSISFIAVSCPDLCTCLLCDLKVPLQRGPLGHVMGISIHPCPFAYGYLLQSVCTYEQDPCNRILQHPHNHVRTASRARELCCPICRSSQMNCKVYTKERATKWWAK